MNIIFVCHGSICRSPAAMMIFKSLCKAHNVIARALSYEEYGNGLYPPMKQELLARDIKITEHTSYYLSDEDYKWANYIFYMDNSNRRLLEKRFDHNEKKILPICYFTHSITEIEDPWYTGRYEKVVDQITQCIQDIIKHL